MDKSVAPRKRLEKKTLNLRLAPAQYARTAMTQITHYTRKTSSNLGYSRFKMDRRLHENGDVY